MTAVVDASFAVAVTWEAAVDDQLDEVFGGTALVPPLFVSEIANAALSKVRRGVLSLDDARAGIRYLADSVTITQAVTEMVAFDVALDTDLSVYDAAYLSCARALNVPLWTLDRRLREAAEASGVTVLP